MTPAKEERIDNRTLDEQKGASLDLVDLFWLNNGGVWPLFALLFVGNKSQIEKVTGKYTMKYIEL